MMRELKEKINFFKPTDLKLYFFLFILTATSLNYFYATFLPEAFKAFRILYLFGCVIFGLYFFNSYKGEFALPVKLLSLSMLFSILISYVSWDHPIYLGVYITIPILLWPIFFLMLKLRISVSLLENIILIFGIFYILFYFYQFFNPTNILFATNSGVVTDGEYVEKRGIIRIIFPGAGIFWLASYIALVKLTNGGKNKLFWAIFAILGLIIPLMQVTRSVIVPTFLVFAFHLLKNLNLNKKLILGGLALIIVPFLLEFASPIIDGLLGAQERDSQEGYKNVRLIAANYFFFDFPPSTLNYIFGNGMGHGNAQYGKFLENLMKQGFYISDIGILGVYTYFGIFFVLGWIIIFFKVYTIKIDSNHMYIKYYFVNILFGAITSASLYHPGSLISSIFAIYIFQKILKENRLRVIKKLISNCLKEKPNKENVEMAN